eukprot:1842543-Alexandrium_andersonii.AAC.1
MKAKQSMKAKKATKSNIAKGKSAMRQVYTGKKVKTTRGLRAWGITKNKYSCYVSKRRSQNARRHPWAVAVSKARQALGLQGF